MNQSVANWWPAKLHKRFLQQPGNFELLQDAVLEIKDKHFTREKIKAKLDSYYDVISPSVLGSPDVDYSSIANNTDEERIQIYNRIYSALESVVDEGYQLFLERLGDPMSFRLNTPFVDNEGLLNFTWAISESLTGAEIKYDIEISTSSDFDEQSVIITEEQLTTNAYKLRWTNPTGRYFYRVKARDTAAPDVNLQISSNDYRPASGPTVRGVKAFDAVNNPTIESNVRPDGVADFTSAVGTETITIDVLANDEGNELTLREPNAWSFKGGNVALVDNQLSYTAKADFVGNDKIWYVLEDPLGRSDYAEVTISVTAPDIRPDGVADAVTINPGETITIDVLANDEGSELTIREPNAWSLRGGNVALIDNQISYTPGDGFTGEDKLWYVFSDPQGRSDYAEVTITVNDNVMVAETLTETEGE